MYRLALRMVQRCSNRMNPSTTYNISNSQFGPQKYLIGRIFDNKYLNDQWRSYKNQPVTCAGWVRSIRASNKILFLDLLDGTSSKPIQIIVENTHPQWQKYKQIKKGFSVKITGVVKQNEASGSKNQNFELNINKQSQIEILGTCNPAKYILSAKNVKFQTTRQFLHFRSRTLRTSTIARIRNKLSFDTHNFFQQNGFINLHTPIITTSDCEGAGQMFYVTTLLKDNQITKDDKGNIDFSKDFFKKPAGLTVSGQLAAEAFCCGMSKVYTFGPTFRAEVSHTTRHVAQFWMIEPEFAFGDLYDAMDLAEAYIKYCVKSVASSNSNDFKFLSTVGESKNLEQRILSKVQKFQRITYTDAVKQLQKHNKNFKTEVSWGCDLSTEHQRFLCQNITKCPTFVYNYPEGIKPFYMRVNDDGKTVASFDLLVPGIGQIIGGSQRQQRIQRLEERMDKMGISKQNYQWYLDLRRFGSVPHAGFGVGFDRLVMFCTQTQNIRDVVPFPRTPGNADC